jgi:YVTN family beta-propeller protein
MIILQILGIRLRLKSLARKMDSFSRFGWSADFQVVVMSLYVLAFLIVIPIFLISSSGASASISPLTSSCSSSNSRTSVQGSLLANTTVYRSANVNNEKTRSVKVGDAPYFDAYDSSNNMVYVANSGVFTKSSISIIRGTRVVATIGQPPICSNDVLQGVAYDSANKLVYAADQSGDEIIVINGTSVVSTISHVVCPLDVAYDAVDSFVLVSNNCELANTNTITVISGLKILRVVEMSEDRASTPAGIAYAEGKIFVANQYDNNVSVISSSTLKMIGSIPVGSEPTEIAFDPIDHRLYVTDILSGNVSVIDVASLRVVATIPVGRNPFGVAFSPATLHVYVSNFGGDKVSIIDGLSVINTVRAGRAPVGFAYDSVNQFMYVADNTEVGFVTLISQ